jgi:hypothetical protein
MLIKMKTAKMAHRVLGGNEDSVGNWTGHHSRYVLEKNLSIFCLCLETLNEAEFKRNALINLVQKM